MQWENGDGAGPLSGSIFSGRSRPPITHGRWDCTRIAIGLWIAACAGFVFVAVAFVMLKLGLRGYGKSITF